MYTDKRNGRTLLRDGTSLLSSFGYAKNVITSKLIDECTKVASDFHSETYDYLNKTDLSCEVVDIKPEPQSHQHSEEQLERLISMIEKSERMVDSDEFYDRIEKELEYFTRSKNITFILSCFDLVEKFRQDGIVWGVGRGSSCASLIFYLLEINDINPLTFNIPFSELSKEQ